MRKRLKKKKKKEKRIITLSHAIDRMVRALKMTFLRCLIVQRMMMMLANTNTIGFLFRQEQAKNERGRGKKGRADRGAEIKPNILRKAKTNVEQFYAVKDDEIKTTF